MNQFIMYGNFEQYESPRQNGKRRSAKPFEVAYVLSQLMKRWYQEHCAKSFLIVHRPRL
jgi:hypothetical protein